MGGSNGKRKCICGCGEEIKFGDIKKLEKVADWEEEDG